MKNRYIIVFTAIIILNLLFRFIMPDEISDVRAMIYSVFIVILPFIYANSGFFLAKLSWQTVGIVTAALLFSGIVMTVIFSSKPLLDEFGWIFMQIPSLLLSFGAGYFTFSQKTRRKKVTFFVTSMLVLILAFAAIYGFCSFMVSWSNSSM